MDGELGQWKYRSLLALLILFAVVLCTRLVYVYISDIHRFPINTVKVAATFKRIPRERIEKVLSAYQQYSYYSLPQKQLKQDLLAIDWANDVQVSRIYPDTLSIKLVEKEPIALWNDAFITHDGKLFNADEPAEKSKLPLLKGPDIESKEVLQIFKKLSKLLATFDLHVAVLHLHENRSWDLALTNGIFLRLGKQDIEKRLERFCKAFYTVFPTQYEQLASVDLRYERGMAVQWRQQTGK